MQHNWKIFSQSLERCPMFNNIDEKEIIEFLECSGAYIKEFAKGQVIISQGDKIDKIGIMLCGKAQAVKISVGGNEILAAKILNGQMFADLLAASEGNESPVTIKALESSKACFIPWKSVLFRCEKNCTRHTTILENLIIIFSHKFFELFDRIDCLTARKLEDKIITLLEKNKKPNNNIIILPFDREGMANYLGIDRSALSRELSKMKKDGIIRYYKNEFIIL